MFWEKPSLPDGTAARGEPTTFGDVVGATFDSMKVVDNSNARNAALERAYDQRIDALTKAGIPHDLVNPERQAVSKTPEFPVGQGEAMDLPDPREEFQKKLYQLADKHPQHYDIIKPDHPVLEDAKKIAREAEERFADVWSRSRGTVAPWTGRMVGGFGGSMLDPINQAALAAGPWGRAGTGAAEILWMGLKAGAVNAGAEAAVQPLVQSWRKEAGLDYGISHSALAVAGAFGFGLAGDAGIRSLYRGGQRLAGRVPILDAEGKVSGYRAINPDLALDEAARMARDATLRKAAEGDLDALSKLAKEAKLDDDPAMRGARQAAEVDAELAGKPPGLVDESEGLSKLAQALRNATDDDEPLPRGADPIPPARREMAHITDDGPTPPSKFTFDGKPASFEKIPARSIGVDAQTFQFKGGGNGEGVTRRLMGVEQWDPLAAGRAIVYERLDGSRVIADGHQRLALAKRLEESGHEPIDLPATVFREEDGWTPSDVRAIAARKNLQEGSGDVIDAARAIRERPDIIDSSVPLSAHSMRQARALARLSDDAFADVMAGRIAPNHGALIGEHVEARSEHGAIARALAEADPANEREARHIIADLQHGPREEVNEILLGGHPNQMLLQERAQVLDQAIKLLKDDAKIFEVVAREAPRLSEVGNRIAIDPSADRSMQSVFVGEVLTQFASRPGPLRDLLDDAARAVAADHPVKKVAKDFADDVREALVRDGLAAFKPEPPPRLRGQGLEIGSPEYHQQIADLEDTHAGAIQAALHKVADRNLDRWLDLQRLNKREVPALNPLVRREVVNQVAAGEVDFRAAIRLAKEKIAAEEARRQLDLAQAEADAGGFKLASTPEEVAAVLDMFNFVQLGQRLGTEETRASPQYVAMVAELKRYRVAGAKTQEEARQLLEKNAKAPSKEGEGPQQKAAALRADEDADFVKRQTVSDDEIESVLDMWRYVDEMRKAKPPESLSAWLKRAGGIREGGGEIKNMLGELRQRPGLVSKKGMHLDDATLRAWEEGFLPGTERPAINDLIAALDEDLRGNSIVRDADRELADNHRVAREMENDLAEFGIRKGHTEADVRRIIGARNQDIAAKGRGGAQDRAKGAGPNGDEEPPFFAVAAIAQEQRKAFDDLGFYSQALEAAKALRQAKGTPQQMRAMLKSAGVKDAEIAATGLDGFLEGKPSVTRDQIVKHLEDNRVQLREVKYGPRQTVGLIPGAILDDLRELDNLGFDTAEQAWQNIRQHPDWQDRWDVVSGRSEAETRIVNYMEENPAYGKDVAAPAKYQKWSIDPSNPTYRETVIQLRDVFTERFDELGAFERRLQQKYDFHPTDARSLEEFQKRWTPEERAEYERISASVDSAPTTPGFKQGHFSSEKDAVAHARTSLQKDKDGKAVFLIDELQSDWGQKLREGGVRDEAKIADLTKRHAEAKAAADAATAEARSHVLEEAHPATLERLRYRNNKDLGRMTAFDLEDELRGMKTPEAQAIRDKLGKTMQQSALLRAELDTATAATPGHPLVTTTDQWTSTAFRRLISQAVEAGADKIAIIPGKVASDRFNLARQVDSVQFTTLGPSFGKDMILLSAHKDGKQMVKETIPRSELANYVGKELAEKLEAQKPDPRMGSVHELSGLDLEIGGHGMKAAYDQIYPRNLGKLLKQFDPEIKGPSREGLFSSMDGREFEGPRPTGGESHANKYLQRVNNDVDVALRAALEDRRQLSNAPDNAFAESQVQLLDEAIAVLQADKAGKPRSTKPIQFHVFPLTEKVKATVREEGQPMFAAGQRSKGEGAHFQDEDVGSTGGDWIDEHWAELSRKGTAFEQAGDAARRVVRRVEDPSAEQGRAEKLVRDIKAAEAALRKEGRPPDEIATILNEQFLLDVTGDDISRGKAWWHTDNRRRKITAGGLDEMQRLWAEPGLTYVDIARQLTKFQDAPVTIFMVMKAAQRDRARFPAREGGVPAALAGDDLAEMAKVWPTARTIEDVAEHMSTHTGRDISPDAVIHAARRDRERFPERRALIQQPWTPGETSLLNVGHIRSMPAEEAAPLLSELFGRRVTPRVVEDMRATVAASEEAARVARLARNRDRNRQNRAAARAEAAQAAEAPTPASPGRVPTSIVTERMGRQAADLQITRGDAVTIRPQIVDATLQALKPMADVVPEGIRVGVLMRVDPVEGKAKVRALFRNIDGSIGEVIGPWDAFHGTRALYVPTIKSIIFYRAGFSGSFDQSVRGELWHELVHAVRNINAVDGRVWDLLVDHAKRLRILDQKLDDYLEKVGRSDASSASDDTIRLRYEFEYRDFSPDSKAERFNQEAVAHMLELIHHRALSAEEIRPIAPLLEQLFNGKSEHITRLLSGIEQDKPMFALMGPQSQSADLMLLNAAQSMERAGRTEEDIFRLTNWFRDASGKWSYEASDRMSSLKVPAGAALSKGRDAAGLADDMLHHPTLFDGYPELRDLGVELNFRAGPPQGEADLALGKITIWADNPADARLKMLGELQKFIQRKEGFAEGGTPASAIAVVQRLQQDIDVQAGAALERLTAAMAQPSGLRRLVVGGVDDSARLSAREMQGLRDQLSTMKAMRDELDSLSMWEAYRRLSGSVAARNVERRADWTPEMRKATSVRQSEDVPRSQQIVTAGAQRQFSTDDPEHALWAEMSRRSHLIEQAVEHRDTRKVAPRKAEPRTEDLPEIKAVADFERAQMAAGKSAKDVATALNAKFPDFAPFDPVAIAKREVWWRIDDIIAGESGKQVRWKPEDRAEMARLYREGVKVKEIAERMSELLGRPLSLHTINSQLDYAGLRTNKRKVPLAQVWTEKRNLQLTDLWQALSNRGLSKENQAIRVAEALKQTAAAEPTAPTAQITARTVLDQARKLGLDYTDSSRRWAGHNAWPKEWLAALTSDEIAALSASEAATILNKRFPDAGITRNAVLGKRNRIAKALDQQMAEASRLGIPVDQMLAEDMGNPARVLEALKEAQAPIIDTWRFVQDMRNQDNRRHRPMRLALWLREQGGVRDEGGELKAMLGSNKELPGFINNRDGLSLDGATLRAWEEGFLPGTERPGINALLDALGDDLQGRPIVRQIDTEFMDMLSRAKEMEDELAQYGIHEAKSEAEVRAILHNRRAGDTGGAQPGGRDTGADQLRGDVAAEGRGGEGAGGPRGAQEDARGYGALDDDGFDEPPFFAIAGDVRRRHAELFDEIEDRGLPLLKELWADRALTVPMIAERLSQHLGEHVEPRFVEAFANLNRDVLPDRRALVNGQLPSKTREYEQARLLMQVEGKSAQQAADEVGVSKSGLNKYLKKLKDEQDAAPLKAVGGDDAPYIEPYKVGLMMNHGKPFGGLRYVPHKTGGPDDIFTDGLLSYRSFSGKKEVWHPVSQFTPNELRAYLGPDLADRLLAQPIADMRYAPPPHGAVIPGHELTGLKKSYLGEYYEIAQLQAKEARKQARVQAKRDAEWEAAAPTRDRLADDMQATQDTQHLSDVVKVCKA